MAPRRRFALLVLVSLTCPDATTACTSDDDQAAPSTTATLSTPSTTATATPPTTAATSGPPTSAGPTTAPAPSGRTIPVLKPVPFTGSPATVDYEVTGAYAELDGLAAAVAPAVNATLAAHARDVVTRFEHDLTDLVGNVPHEPGVGSGIDLAPSAPLLTPQLASVRLDVLRYFEGGRWPVAG